MKEEIKFSIIEVENRYKIPVGETVNSGNKMVSWGVDNDIPQLLWNCYSKSATLKSVIDGCVNYILGDSIEVTEKWAKEINRRGQTMADLIRHIGSDLVTYGNFAIQVIFNKMGEVVELYPLDVAKCRQNENRTKVFYSKKGWTKYQTKSEEFDAFNLKKIDPEKPTQIFFYAGEGVRSTYAKAPWEAAIFDVLTEIEATKYSLNTVANGFSSRYILNYPESDNLTDEQKKAIEKGIQQKFCGSEASTFGLYFGDDGRKMEVAKIEVDDAPEKYEAIRKAARENIFISMRATPVLFGLVTAANGFATSEYSDSFKLFQRTVIQPMQDIIERSLSKITSVPDVVKITPFVITFEQ